MNEKIIEKIRKLLEMTQENGASENEAMVAALRAQELMAKYNIDLIDVQGVHTSEEEICDIMINMTEYEHVSTKWSIRLAGIIAGNFRCKVYTIGKSTVVFYGFKTDAKIASDVFKFLFNTGLKLAPKYYRQCKKEGKPTKGAASSYLIGYCQGIADVLEKQCVALMIVTSPKVEESWKEKSSGWKKTKVNFKNSDADAYSAGRTDGRATANARSIEG